MNLLSFLAKILVPEEPIAGLEITDSHLRLALLSLDKKTGVINTEEYFEQSIEPGIIVSGVVKNPDRFYSTLLEFKKGLRLPIDYVIASIPFDRIYTKTLSFPKNIEGPKLDEAIKLAVEFQFPYKMEESYCSWKINAGQNPQKVFVAQARKNIIDPYLENIRKVFNLIALEFHAASISRLASLGKGKAVLLKITSQASASFFVIKDNVIDFSRTLEFSLPEKKIKSAPEKIADFYEAAYGEKIFEIIDLSAAAIPIDEKIKFPEPGNSRWLAALGAAKRGIIPRREDDFVSLSPISAQKAYKYHKAVNFSSIMTKLIVGLSIFFTASFLGTWILMIALQQQTAGKTDNVGNLPSMSQDMTAVEQRIQKANELIAATAGIMKSSPRWSIVIDELQNSIIDGITVNSLNLPTPEGTVTITGAASNRTTLNKFRDKLKSLVMFGNVNLPLANLEQRQNIPFSVSFQLSNPNSIYSQ
jgi:Tfp pilus assembly protein PilN